MGWFSKKSSSSSTTNNTNTTSQVSGENNQNISGVSGNVTITDNGAIKNALEFAKDNTAKTSESFNKMMMSNNDIASKSIGATLKMSENQSNFMGKTMNDAIAGMNAASQSAFKQIGKNAKDMATATQSETGQLVTKMLQAFTILGVIAGVVSYSKRGRK